MFIASFTGHVTLTVCLRLFSERFFNLVGKTHPDGGGGTIPWAKILHGIKKDNRERCLSNRILPYFFDNLPRYNQDILINIAALRATFLPPLHDGWHPQSMKYNKPFYQSLLTSGLLLE